ncbi:MAG: hypothetical protein AB7H88_16095 [Vicinamibacterales bacterium]
MPARPAIAVILTGDVPAAGRRRCRAAFGRQSVPAARIELLDAAGAGPIGRRRNRAVAAARAPFLLFWDYAWHPLPGLIAYCLDQHARHDAAGDAVLVHAEPGIGARHSPIARWWQHLGGWPARPATDGVYAWPHFRAPGLSVRAELFERARFDDDFAAGDDAELAARLSSRLPLCVWFERFALATIEDVPSIEAVVAAAWQDGYFRRLRWARTPALRDVADLQAVHAEPQRFERPAAQAPAMWATVRGLEASFEGVDLSFRDKDQTDRLQVLFEACEILVNAAIADGHRAALAGEPPAVPPAPSLASPPPARQSSSSSSRQASSSAASRPAPSASRSGTSRAAASKPGPSPSGPSGSRARGVAVTRRRRPPR